MRYTRKNSGSVTFNFRNPQNQLRIVTGPLSTTWPELWAQFDSPGKRVERSSYSGITTDELLSGYSAYWRNLGTDPVLPTVQELYRSVDLGSIRARTENYRERKAAGEVIMNPYWRGSFSEQRSAGFVFTGGSVIDSARRNIGPYTYTTWLPGPFPATAALPGERVEKAVLTCSFDWVLAGTSAVLISPTAVINSYLSHEIDTATVTAALAKRNDGAMDVLTEFVEFPETLAFLTTESKKFLGLATDLELEARAKKNTLSPSKYLKWLSNHWLKGRYALMPLIYSLSDISEVLRQMGREYGRFSVSNEIQTPLIPVLAAEGAYVVTTSDALRHSCVIKSRYSPDDFLSGLASVTKFNIPATFYETIPLSFVLDWGINMGEYLSAAFGTDLSKESKCSYAFKDNRTVSLRYNTGDPVKDALITKVYLNLYERKIINPSDHIGLAMGFDMNWKRYVDAMALSLAPSIKAIRSLK